MLKFSVSHSTLTEVLGQLDGHGQGCQTRPTLLTGRAESKEGFCLGNDSTKNMGIEVIYNVQDTVNAC